MRHIFFCLFTVLACSGSSTPNDAGSDAKPSDSSKNDSPTGDGGGGCASGLACEVCTSGVSNTLQMKPPQAHANVCAGTDISAFVAACGSNGSDMACSTWQMNEMGSAPNCLGCIYSQDGDAKWGVNYCDTTATCNPNIGGCIDVVLGTVAQEKQAGGAGSCGDLWDAVTGCEGNACNTCNGTDYDTCLNSADSNECKPQNDAANNPSGACSALGTDAAMAAAACFLSTDTDLTTVVTTMCGM